MHFLTFRLFEIQNDTFALFDFSFFDFSKFKTIPLHFSTFRLFEIQNDTFALFNFSTFRLFEIQNDTFALFDFSLFDFSKFKTIPLHFLTFRLFEIQNDTFALFDFSFFDFSKFKTIPLHFSTFRLFEIQNDTFALFNFSTFRNSKRYLCTFRLFIVRLFEIQNHSSPPGALRLIFPPQNPPRVWKALIAPMNHPFPKPCKPAPKPTVLLMTGFAEASPRAEPAQSASRAKKGDRRFEQEPTTKQPLQNHSAGTCSRCCGENDKTPFFRGTFGSSPSNARLSKTARASASNSSGHSAAK